MAISTKILKTRIRSIKNTRKITKAMELVAASKMRRAVHTVLMSRAYSSLAWEILKRLKRCVKHSQNILLHEPGDTKQVLMVLIASNRGLCGGYNTQIFQKAQRTIGKIAAEGLETNLIVVGKKGKNISHKLNKHVIAVFEKEDVIHQINEIFPVSRFVQSEYSTGKYKKVLVAYTDFISSLRQVPRIRQIIPIQDEDEFAQDSVQITLHEKEKFDYVFEPTSNEVLSAMLPRLIEVQFYQAHLEANASEHSARMMAMQNASEAASDFIFDLTLSFNQARQSAITREIAEISAGKAVIE